MREWLRRRGLRVRLVDAGLLLLVIVIAGSAVVVARSRSGQSPRSATATVSSPGTSLSPQTTGTPAGAVATPSPVPAPAPAAAAATAAPPHFATLPPGSTLPSGAQCTAWVRAKPLTENKVVNRAFNSVQGHSLSAGFFPVSDDSKANLLLAPRVDGRFTGTTHQILRWAACKWGIDEDIVAAQAAQESWWRQTTLGDWGTDPAACPPGHAPGVDGKPGQCPQSYGILQNRWSVEQSSWPGIGSSTAMNADTAYAIWRACFEGYELWLNNVNRGSQYGAGDAWGCVGRWFSGRWHTPEAEGYIAHVHAYLNQRVWEQPNFQEA